MPSDSSACSPKPFPSPSIPGQKTVVALLQIFLPGNQLGKVMFSEPHAFRGGQLPRDKRSNSRAGQSTTTRSTKLDLSPPDAPPACGTIYTLVCLGQPGCRTTGELSLISFSDGDAKMLVSSTQGAAQTHSPAAGIFIPPRRRAPASCWQKFVCKFHLIEGSEGPAGHGLRGELD